MQELQTLKVVDINYRLKTLADFSSASYTAVCFSDWKEDRQDYACAIFFQQCIQKQCFKNMEIDLNSHFLDCGHNKVMQIWDFREFMLWKSNFWVIYKENHDPWDNIKLLLTGQFLIVFFLFFFFSSFPFFLTTKIFNLFMQIQGQQLLPRFKAAILLQQ